MIRRREILDDADSSAINPQTISIIDIIGDIVDDILDPIGEVVEDIVDVIQDQVANQSEIGSQPAVEATSTMSENSQPQPDSVIQADEIPFWLATLIQLFDVNELLNGDQEINARGNESVASTNENEVLSEDVSRSIQATQQHEPGFIQSVLNVTNSAKEALQLMFAEIGDISEDDAQRLLANIPNGNTQGLVNDLQMTRSFPLIWNSNPEQQGDSNRIFFLQDDAFLDCSGEGAAVQAKCALLNVAWDRAGEGFTGEQKDELLKGVIQDGKIDPDQLAQNIEDVLGFKDVVWDNSNYTPEQRAAMTLNLLSSALHIVAYFDEEVLTRDEDRVTTSGDVSLTGLEIFQQFFADEGEITVHLGADEITGDPEAGLVPLYNDPPDKHIYLGEQMSVATIVHEFGHQLDRTTLHSIPNSLVPLADYGVELSNLPNHIAPVREANFDDWGKLPEDFADAFMTAVLHGQGVQSSGQTIRWGIGDNAADMRLAIAVHLLVTLDDAIQDACYEIEGPIYDRKKETICVP